jgi:hypothetical protein
LAAGFKNSLVLVKGPKEIQEEKELASMAAGEADAAIGLDEEKVEVRVPPSPRTPLREARSLSLK